MKQTVRVRTGAPVDRRSDVYLPPIESVRLYQQIANMLSTRIDQGLFPVGSFLPAERELAEQLGVSRTSVREALIALEIGGKVSIRAGHGVQVLEASAKPVATPPTDSSDTSDIGPIQVMEARVLVEPWTAELAAEHHTAHNLDRMRSAMALQAEASTMTATQYHEGDRLFHAEIARASGNPAFEVLVSSLWRYRTKPLFSRFEALLVGPTRPAQTFREHQEVFNAIAAGDAVGAGQAMKRHLDAVLRAFIKGTGQ